MNDVKKKLVELLNGKSIDLESDAEYVADLLIENGVTILPEGAIVLTRSEIEALNEYQKKLNEGVITNTENKSNNSADMSNKQIEEMRYLADEMGEAISTEYEKRVLADERKLEAVLRENGWRKASDVAEEICAAADEIINTICIMTGIEITAVGGKYLELRKKYTKGEDK